MWRKKIEEGKVEETFVVSLLRRRGVRQNWRVECDVTFFPPQVHITKLDNYFWEEEKNQGKSLWKEDLLLLMRFFLFGKVSMIFDPLVILDGINATEKRYAPKEFAM